MTTRALPTAERQGDWRTTLWRSFILAISVAGNIPGVLRVVSQPAIRHLTEHVYSICGFGLISAAAFTHSVFTGLLVTGIMFLVFEWKVAE